MTFKEYLHAIYRDNEIFCIEEKCDGRFIATHTVFGFNEPDVDNIFEIRGVLVDTNEDYVLHGDGRELTLIDSAQPVGLKPNDKAVYVIDRGGNHLELVFCKCLIIDHPKIENS